MEPTHVQEHDIALYHCIHIIGHTVIYLGGKTPFRPTPADKDKNTAARQYKACVTSAELQQSFSDVRRLYTSSAVLEHMIMVGIVAKGS